MNKMENIFRVIGEAFEGKVDKGGMPYTFHLLRVANTIRSRYSFDYDIQMAAYCHDLLEDVPSWTPEKLGEYVSERVVTLVKILTRKKGESYHDYIERIALDRDAIEIKLADLEDNMDITRLLELTDKDIERLKKYHKYYIYLNELK